MNWSFQLYSARNFLPWDGILEMVAKAGYRQVEGFGGVYDDPPAFRKKMDANGLSMPTGHFGIDMLEGDFAGAADIAKTLGVTNIICPFLMPDQRPKDKAGWVAFGKRLAEAGEAARKAGFDFGWHNHNFEFEKLPDGSMPMDAILEAARRASQRAVEHFRVLTAEHRRLIRLIGAIRELDGHAADDEHGH